MPSLQEIAHFLLKNYLSIMFKNNLSIYLVLFWPLFFDGNNQQLIDEINRINNANFGGYTKSNPLRVYVSPFKPHREWEESEIGKILWQEIVDGVKDIAFFSDKKVVFVGPKAKSFVEPKNRSYYSIDEETYNNVLETDNFWTTKGGSVKKRLKRLANSRAANFIIYGVYDSDDNSMKLTVYLYDKNDDVILKERLEIKARFKVAESFIEGKQSDRKLTKAEEAFQKMIHEKLKVSAARLLRKYMEGR